LPVNNIARPFLCFTSANPILTSIQLVDKESSLEALHVEVMSSNAKIREDGDKAKELADLQTKHQAELEDVKSELNSANQRYERANQQVQELKQSLKGFAEAQQEATKVVQLTEEPQQEHAKVLNLHQEIAPLEGIARQVPALRQQVSEKHQAIESLESRIKEAETSSMRIAKMEQNARRSAEEISALRVKLRTAEESASSAGEQKEDFDKTTKEAGELRKKPADLQPLVNRFSALQEEAQGHLDEVIRLQQELGNAKNSVDQLQGLRETSRRSSAEIVSLQKQVSAADSELKRLQSVKDVCDRKDQEMVTLSERLRAAEDNLNYFKGLEEAIRDKDEHIMTLNRELDVAKDSLKHLKSAQDANGRKDEEIASLKQRLGAAESILNDAQVVREESQRKEIELMALKDKLANIEETSQQLLQTLAERLSQTHGASQWMTAIQDGVTVEDRNFPAGLAVTRASSPDLAHQLGCQANWNDGLVYTRALQTAIAEIVHIDSKGRQSLMLGQSFDTTKSSQPAPIADSEIRRTQETTFVPESQPVVDSPCEAFPIDAPYFGSMSSPLANIGSFIASSDEVHYQSVYFGPEKVVDGSASTFTKIPANFKPSPGLSVSSQKDPPSSRPPSSSCSDTMLLEAEEELRNLGQHGATAVQESSAQQSGPQSGSTSPGRPLAGKSGGTSHSRIQKPSNKTAKTKSKRNPSVSPKHPSPRRWCSESQTRPKMVIPLGERASSDQNIPVSPLRGMLRDKHLPNSAAKRRFEDDEMSIPPSHHDFKRLKRNLPALEVKTPTNQKGTSFLNQVAPATGIGRLNHPSMPAGGRKGSIVGTNAPAPCTGLHTNKKPKKKSKTGRYSVQFGKEAT
jgi:predicted  nucleic acid-binding Zn-ribbon protein